MKYTTHVVFLSLLMTFMTWFAHLLSGFAAQVVRIWKKIGVLY